MEVCVDCMESALNAVKGGAIRLELCSDLSSGGTTPSLGLLRAVKYRIKDIPVFVMIRSRGGDFCYSDGEMEVMKQDVAIMKSEGADGFVFGALNPDGMINQEHCNEVLLLAKPLPVTFHRAFDMTKDPLTQLEVLIKLGFQCVLTSGQCKTALEGLPLIKELVQCAKGRVVIMPGAGINTSNIQTIIDQSNAREFHGSASMTRDSLMKYRNEDISMGTRANNEYSTKITDTGMVTELIALAQEIWKQKENEPL